MQFTKSEKKDKKVKLKKAPGAPKRFKSAFMFYSEHRHKEVRSQSTNKKVRAAVIAKEVSMSWRALSEEDRYEWNEMGRLDRERYEREKALYKGPWKVPDVKDPNAPKKPVSAFFAFSNERKKSIAMTNPSMSGTEISTLLSQMWREYPDHAKQKYRDIEARNREMYRQQRADWERQRSLPHFNAGQSETVRKNNSPINAGVDSDEGKDSNNGKLSPWFGVFQDMHHHDSPPSLKPPPRSSSLSTSAAKPHNQVALSSRKHQVTEVLGAFHPVMDEPPCTSLAVGRGAQGASTTRSDPRSTTFRFANYSMDDVLDDDELFHDDFLPSDVPNTATHDMSVRHPTNDSLPDEAFSQDLSPPSASSR